MARVKRSRESELFNSEPVPIGSPKTPFLNSLHGEKIFEARDAAHAVAMATEFREQGLYDTFRGQCCAKWTVMPSQVRPGVNQDDALRRIDDFVAWLDQKRGIKKLGLSLEQVLAIAQHYGIPTMLMDFTTSPSVAGFFATDGAALHGCSHGTIYMINSNELTDVMGAIRAVRKELQLEIVRVNVDNLWRLNAQHGVFLFTNAQNFELFFSLDKIVFAHDYRASPTMSHDDIYPADKSPLELDIEHYFFLESQPSLNEMKEMFRNMFPFAQEEADGFSWERIQQQSERIRVEGQKALFGRLVEPHVSWSGTCDAAPPRIEWPSNSEKLILKLDLDIGDTDHVARSEMEGRIEFVRGSLFYVEIDNFPNALVERRKEFRELLQLYFAATHWLDVESSSLCNGAMYLAKLFMGQTSSNARTIRIEFVSNASAHRRVTVPIEKLVACLRDDFDNLVLENNRNLRSDDFERLLAWVPYPKYLFNHDYLAELFASHLVPQQLIDDPEMPVTSSPGQLVTFGLP